MKYLSVVLLLFFTLSTYAKAQILGKNFEVVKEEIIERCKLELLDEGYALVKLCVDDDIKAYKKLDTYPQEYKNIITRCMNEYSEEGYALVKLCVDDDIKAKKLLDEY